VVLGQLERCLFFDGNAVQAVFQDGFDGAVGDALDREGPETGSLQTLRRVAFPETEDAQARAVALLRMMTLLDDSGDDSGCMGSRLLGSPGHAGGVPFEVFPVGLGPVEWVGSKAPFPPTPCVSRHALAVIQDLHGGGREAHVDLLADHEIRNAVEVVLNDEVVVNIDPSFAVLGILVAGGGQRLQSRSVHDFEQGAAGAIKLLEGTIVEGVQQSGDLSVQLSETEEGVIT
jgi:hypothetical protein